MTKGVSRTVAVVLAALAPAGCVLPQSSGGFALGGGAAGSGGEGGARPEGGSGGGGGAMNCSALPFGCVCAPSEPSQVGTCTTAAVVKAAGQQGVCCDGAIHCICVAYECLRTDGACTCQLAQASAPGTRVGDCGAVSADPNVRCCRSYGQCVCGAADCLLSETPVSGCSVQDLLGCGAGETSVASCEETGTGAGASL